MYADVNFLVPSSPDLETSQKLVENEKKCIEELIRERDTLSKVRTSRAHNSQSSASIQPTLLLHPLLRLNKPHVLFHNILKSPLCSLSTNVLARHLLFLLTRVATQMPQNPNIFTCAAPSCARHFVYF